MKIAPVILQNRNWTWTEPLDGEGGRSASR